MKASRYVQHLWAQRDNEASGWQQLVQQYDEQNNAVVRFCPRASVLYRSVCHHQIPLEIFTPASAQGAVLFLHGGDYIGGVTDQHRSVAQQVAINTHCTVVLPDYALAPHVYPDALSEVAEAYAYMLAEDNRVTLMGDGSGAHLALTLTDYLRRNAMPLPLGLALISPLVDLTVGGNSYYDNFYLDPIYGAKHLQGLDIPDAFCASPLHDFCRTQDRTDGKVSPLFADLKGFPPCFVTVGSHEVLLDDAVRFAARAKQSGVEVRLLVGEGLFYAYPYQFASVDEAASAFSSLCAFLQGRA